MSAVTSPDPEEARARGARGVVALPAAALVPCLPGAHAGQPTVVDERSRRLTHEELAVAQRLADEGHRVRSVPERRGQGPVPDLEVCGARVEVKSFLSLDERHQRAPTPRSVCNKLLSARDQAPTAVLLGRGSGLTEAVARAGVEEFAARGRPGLVGGVRIIGDDFDLSWATGITRVVGVEHPAGRADTGRYRRSSRGRDAGRELGAPGFSS
jgi:hypothetical protein